MSDAHQQIKARLPIEDIVAETVALKPAGRDRLIGLCPFHAERTPSFYVMTDLRRYYCHGACKRGGDLFDFVQHTRNLSPVEALMLLAERAGVVLKDAPQCKPTKDLADLQTLAQGYFLEGLKGNPEAYSYLIGRGLTPETIEAWGLGYAPDSWHGLIARARNQNVQPEALERAGLAKVKDGRPFDMFRARVTIPIHDAFGRIVGFSARTMGDAQPKYVNSPETDLFKKGEILFGLHRARHTIRERRAAIMVEGQLDVIAAHQAGFTATVGGQSATLTPAQIALFDRLGVTSLYMAFDADEAGQKATLSGLDTVARQFLVKVVKLPGGDPAEVVLESPEAFKDALKRAVPETRFRLERAMSGLDMRKPADKQTALERLKGGMRDARAPFDPVADELRRQVATLLELNLEQLTAWANDGCRTLPITQARHMQPRGDRLHNVRLQLAALTLRDPELTPRLLEKLEAVVPSGDPLATFCAACRCNPGDLDKALETLTDADRTTVHGILAHNLDNVDRAFGHGLRLYRSLTGDVAPAISQLPRETTAELHAYLERFPAYCAAADKRASALTDFVNGLPENEQAGTFGRLTHNLLNGQPAATATNAELLADALALHLCIGAAGDPERHLETARAAVLDR
jgi:DNA primase